MVGSQLYMSTGQWLTLCKPKGGIIMEMDLKTLMTLAENKATALHDGHLTIMRFTTGWKLIPGTPKLDSYRGKERNRIAEISSFGSIQDALLSFVAAY